MDYTKYNLNDMLTAFLIMKDIDDKKLIPKNFKVVKEKHYIRTSLYERELMHDYVRAVTGDYAMRKAGTIQLRNKINYNSNNILRKPEFAKFLAASAVLSFKDEMSTYKSAIKYLKDYEYKYFVINGEHNYIIYNDEYKDIYVITVNEENVGRTALTILKGKNNLNQYIVNKMCELLYSVIDVNSTIYALKTLWVQQYFGSAPNNDTRAFNTFAEILSFIKGAGNTVSTFKPTKKITYKQLIDFYNEVMSQKMTSETGEVQEWLLDTYDGENIETSQAMQNLILSNDDYKDRLTKIHSESPDSIQSIIDEVNKDAEFAKEYEVVHSFGFTGNESFYDKDGYNFMTLAHGTKFFSVSSIILNGIKTNVELLKARQEKEQLGEQQDEETQTKLDLNYSYTGSGLGDGIYFARLDQINKSANYTTINNAKYGFIFVADVRYRPGKMKTRGYYDSHKSNRGLDLVKGSKVGSGGRDEFVSPYSSNVNITHLLIIKLKDKNKK